MVYKTLSFLSILSFLTPSYADEQNNLFLSDEQHVFLTQAPPILDEGFLDWLDQQDLTFNSSAPLLSHHHKNPDIPQGDPHASVPQNDQKDISGEELSNLLSLSFDLSDILSPDFFSPDQPVNGEPHSLTIKNHQRETREKKPSELLYMDFDPSKSYSPDPSFSRQNVSSKQIQILVTPLMGNISTEATSQDLEDQVRILKPLWDPHEKKTFKGLSDALFKLSKKVSEDDSLTLVKLANAANRIYNPNYGLNFN